MTIFMSMRTQYENLGDEIINTILLSELVKRGSVIALTDGVPDWYIQNVNKSLGESAKRLNLISSSKRFAFEIIKSGFTSTKNILFLSCGDSTSETSNGRVDKALVAISAIASVNIAMVGASYFRISESRKRLLKRASDQKLSTSNHFNGISVRDQTSREFLLKQKIDAKVIPDLAFMLPVKKIGRADRKLVIFQMRETASESVYEISNSVKKIADLVRRCGLIPKIMIQVDRDLSFSEKISELSGVELIRHSKSNLNRREVVEGVYDQTAMIFSNRLHGLLLAASRGAAPMALLNGSELKVRSVFESVGRKDFLLDVTNPSKDRIIEVIEKPSEAEGQWSHSFSSSASMIREYFNDVCGDEVNK